MSTFEGNSFTGLSKANVRVFRSTWIQFNCKRNQVFNSNLQNNDVSKNIVIEHLGRDEFCSADGHQMVLQLHVRFHIDYLKIKKIINRNYSAPSSYYPYHLNSSSFFSMTSHRKGEWYTNGKRRIIEEVEKFNKINNFPTLVWWSSAETPKGRQESGTFSAPSWQISTLSKGTSILYGFRGSALVP